MRARLIVALFMLSLSACAYSPTASTEVAEAPKTTVVVARLSVSVSLQIGGRVAVALSAYDERGGPAPFDGSCTGTSGTIDPQRIVGTGSFVAYWRDALPSRGSVTCTSGGLKATTDVDLSAWTLSFINFREELYAAYLEDRLDPVQWWTVSSLIVQPRDLLDRPANAITVSWGDGAREQLSGSRRTGYSSEAVRHRYDKAGSFDVSAVVEWTGGRSEVRGTLKRTCISHGPILPLPEVPEPGGYGFCSNAFTESRP